MASPTVIKALIQMMARGGKQADEAVPPPRSFDPLSEPLSADAYQELPGYSIGRDILDTNRDLRNTSMSRLDPGPLEDIIPSGRVQRLNPERLPDTAIKRAQRNDPDFHAARREQRDPDPFDPEEEAFIDEFEADRLSRPGGPEELTEHDWLFDQLMDQVNSGESADPAMLKRLDELVPEWGEEIRSAQIMEAAPGGAWEAKRLGPFQSSDKTPEALALFNSGLDDIANNRGLSVIVPKLQKLRQMDQQLGDDLFNELIGDASSSPISASDILPDDIIPF